MARNGQVMEAALITNLFCRFAKQIERILPHKAAAASKFFFAEFKPLLHLFGTFGKLLLIEFFGKILRSGVTFLAVLFTDLVSLLIPLAEAGI